MLHSQIDWRSSITMADFMVKNLLRNRGELICYRMLIHGLPNEILRISLSLLAWRWLVWLGTFNTTLLWPAICSWMPTLLQSVMRKSKVKCRQFHFVCEEILSQCTRCRYYTYSSLYTQIKLFWKSVVRYGRVEVIEWAHQEGRSSNSRL